MDILNSPSGYTPIDVHVLSMNGSNADGLWFQTSINLSNYCIFTNTHNSASYSGKLVIRVFYVKDHKKL